MLASSRRHPLARILVVPLVMLAASTAACWSRPVPPPGFRDPMTATPAEWNSYIAKLTFDSAGLSTDSLVRGAPGARSVIRFASEARVARLTGAQVEAGRIIGRAVANDSVNPVGAPLGVSYVWVDSTGPNWRWLWIADGRVYGRAHPMLRGNTEYQVKSMAGFRMAADTFPNGRCGNRCCLWLMNFNQLTDATLLTRLFASIHQRP